MNQYESTWQQSEDREVSPVLVLSKQEVAIKPEWPLGLGGTAVKKFKGLFRQRNTDECWIWEGWRFKSGYGGFIPSGNRKLRSHRVSYSLFVGPIPEGLEVCHKCDVPACVNPFHLFVGDHYANMRDASSKGRCRAVKGEKQWHSRFFPSQIRCMRLLHKAGVTQTRIAELFQTAKSTIGHIVRRENWKHV